MKKYELGNWIVTLARSDELPGTPLHPRQTHGKLIAAASECVSGQTEADGIMMTHSDPLAAIQTADCLPLVLLTKDIALALHVSRKSLIAGLLDQVPAHLSPTDIADVFIGPHICAKHFTFQYIGREVQQFIDRYPAAVSMNKPTALSLRAAVQQYLDEWRIEKQKIAVYEQCTYENQSLPSYRRLSNSDQQFVDRLYTVVTKKIAAS